MPTGPRRPQAHRKRQQRQARRLRAAELFTAGIHPAEVARQLGVSRQAASTWHAALDHRRRQRPCKPRPDRARDQASSTTGSRSTGPGSKKPDDGLRPSVSSTSPA
jgi:hypothetical protein